MANDPSDIPLEIEDHSHVNYLETTSTLIQQYILELCQENNELRKYLMFFDKNKKTEEESSTLASPLSSSFSSFEEDHENNNNKRNEKFIFGRNFPLKNTHKKLGDYEEEETHVGVELHLNDYTHEIYKQFYCPVFFVIFAVKHNHSVYGTSESRFYLSLLSIAVSAVFHQQRENFCFDSRKVQQNRSDLYYLSSPYEQDRRTSIIPCFVPSGDRYESAFIGLSPSLQTNNHSNVVLSTVHHSTNLLVDRKVNHIKYISDYCHLFQLKIGAHSKIEFQHDNDNNCFFEGMSVSLWRRYEFLLPINFQLLHPKVELKETKKANTIAWSDILEAENTVLRLEEGCGYTFFFGTLTPPVRHINYIPLFTHLCDYESIEVNSKSLLNPFEFWSTAEMIKEEMDPNNKHKNDTLRSVQQKCRLSAEVILKEEKNISHYITGKIVKLKSKLLLDRLRYVVEDELDLLEEKKDDGGKEEGSEAASFFTTHVKQIAEKVTGLRNRNHHNATYSAMLQTQEKILTAIQQLQSVEEDGTTQRKDAYGSSNDLRVTYFPQSLLSRLAFTLSISVEDIQNKESNIVRRIWKEIVGQMQTQFEKGKRESNKEERIQSYKRLIQCVGLPSAEMRRRILSNNDNDNPNNNTNMIIDLNQSLLVQKLQLLSHCFYLLLQEEEKDNNDNKEMEEEEAHPSPYTLLQNKSQTLFFPKPLPQTVFTSEQLLERATVDISNHHQQQNALTEEWLRRDPLFNDMCYFKYINRKNGPVCFADFVRFYSPVDFVNNNINSVEEDDYLSDRMKTKTETNRENNVWFKMWQRSTPKSKTEILNFCFHPSQTAEEVLTWLSHIGNSDSTNNRKSLGESLLIVECVNALSANSLHRMLCHRFLVQHKQQQHLSLCLFARRHLSSVTRHSQQSVQWLELLYDQYLSEEEERRSQCEMQLEHIHRCFGSSWEGINAVETALSTAIAVHSVFNLPPKLGKPTEAEAHHKNRYKTYGYALAELLSRPNLSECFSGDVTRTSIPFQVAVLDNALWCYAAVPSFLTVHPMKEGEIEYKESAARVTCLAERPVHTASGFQEMTVREDNEEGTIKVAFSLSKEVK